MDKEGRVTKTTGQQQGLQNHKGESYSAHVPRDLMGHNGSYEVTCALLKNFLIPPKKFLIPILRTYEQNPGMEFMSRDVTELR